MFGACISISALWAIIPTIWIQNVEQPTYVKAKSKETQFVLKIFQPINIYKCFFALPTPILWRWMLASKFDDYDHEYLFLLTWVLYTLVKSSPLACIYWLVLEWTQYIREQGKSQGRQKKAGRGENRRGGTEGRSICFCFATFTWLSLDCQIYVILDSIEGRISNG